ncbi:hypothetical protein SLS55_000084 [Diplodia seriata]|uniref:4a-hydroxytetrahydrobiopterin dehydratase n=1 Tax=Diplodia seriata TaxID=420778 RepID=A0ABR3CUC4_9PEZI
MASALRSLARLGASPTALVQAHRPHHIHTAIRPAIHLRQALSTRPPQPTKPAARSRPYSTTTTDDTTTDAAAAAPAQPAAARALEPKFIHAKGRELLAARLQTLLATTPWRLTAYNDGKGIDRHFVFATAEQAAAFAARVEARATESDHHPEVSGCGRHVHVLYTTYYTLKGLSESDIKGAEELQAMEIRGLVGAGAGAGAGAGEQQQHPLGEILGEREEAVRELFRPEFRRLGLKGDMTKHEWASGHGGLWEWLKGKVWVEGGRGAEDGGVWPAWGIMFGMACVTQARFVEDESGNLVLAAKEHWPNTDDEDMKKITNETTPLTKQGKISGKVPVMEEMLKQGVLGW